MPKEEGGLQHLERPIFRNFELSNTKITKDELFEILYSFKLFEHSKYIIYQIGSFCSFIVFQIVKF